MTTYRPRRRRVTRTARAVRVARPLLALVVVVALSIVGVTLLRQGTEHQPARHDASPADTVAGSDSRPTSTPKTDSLIGRRTGDVLVLPTLRVRAPLVSVAMSRAGTLTPPRDPTEVGYWSGSSTPGSRRGQTLVTGHTVHTGGGALDQLGTLEPGARVVIHRNGADRTRIIYRVASVRSYTKTELARSAQRLFGQDHGNGRLQLVTCTGWNGHHYSGNVVVTATPQAAETPRV